MGFVIVYRWEIRPGKESQFRQSWEALSQQYCQLYGAEAARLHRGEEQVWMAWTAWPSREQYFLAMERGVPDPEIVEAMDAAVSRRLEPEFLVLEATVE
ncbi:antibiotic biosynthesis monooxygenase [Gammaproteobacteria bacterium AB-CW1]|uniref:Antibiotic biosynthesis monooxygenase n=1 Tax=Natronospira elongata TaxID=3110268 RepID=A0AAP6JF05_9GAMM|nr:antibiotic biosynthesis monooxygenase [Gammaproteobacteria bacterium AB-CW1]